MTQFFGFNDSGENHIAGRGWAPGELDPTAYRFFMPWDNDTWYARRYCDNMLLGQFASGPTRIGIMVMIPAVKAGNPAVPSASDFYWEVREWFNNTPSNLYLQVWNEPNSPEYGTAGVPMPASQCRGLISAAHQAASELGRQVIGPAMNQGVPGWETYMNEAYADLLVQAAVHIYPKSSPWTQDFDNAIKFALSNSNNRNGPFYITEMGLRHTWRNGQGNWVQLYGANWAQYTRDAYIRAAQDSRIGAVIFHRLVRDVSAASFQFDERGRLYFLREDNSRTALVPPLDPYR